MEVEKYNPFVVMNKLKPKAKPKTKHEARGLSLVKKKEIRY